MTRKLRHGWDGRFPRNEIVSLLDVSRRFNLAESTARELTFREVLDLIGPEATLDISLGYGSSQGLPALRERIARPRQILADHVVTTHGTALGLAMLALELCIPGREAILASPCFPPSRDSLRAGGGETKVLGLRFDDGYRLDLERLEALISPRTALVSLATPQNPSGVALRDAEIDATLSLLDELAPDAFLFIDETYREAPYGDRCPSASFAASHPRVITGSSVSKAHGAPGLRVGWLTTTDDILLERLVMAKMNLVISGSPLNESIAAALLVREAEVLGPRRAMLAEAITLVEAWAERHTELIDWVKPDAGALCVMRLRPRVFDDEAVERFWKLLPDEDLQLAGGHWFGEARRVFRLGFGFLPIEDLPPALDALGGVLRSTLNGSGF
ncbi:MAG: pyridoxal phosphate-dependent aminotransferase [Planctomycetota bacterium]